MLLKELLKRSVEKKKDEMDSNFNDDEIKIEIVKVKKEDFKIIQPQK
jgi:hypothetical protein